MKGGGSNIFIDIIRYSVIIVLYFICFLYLVNDSDQFLLFICIFILNFFTIAFIASDMMGNRGILEELGGGPDQMYVSLGLIGILLGGITQFISIAIFLAIFAYAKEQVHTATQYNFVLDYTDMFYRFKLYFIISSFLIGMLGIIIGLKYSDEKTKSTLSNIIFTVFPLTIFGLVGYEMYMSIKLLKVKDYNMQLYNVLSYN